MRVLLCNETPLEGSAAGRSAFDLATALSKVGHDVLCLVVDGPDGREDAAPEGVAVRRIVGSSKDAHAELPFPFPCFVSHPRSRQTFGQLTDAQIEFYRDVLRRRLDRLVESFDPQLIHCQHAWLLAHLALETGVPYAISAQGPELRAFREDLRYQPLVEQAAENASRIFTTGRFLQEEVIATFPRTDEVCQQSPLPLDRRRLLGDLPTLQRDALLWQLGLPTDTGPLVVCPADLAPCEGLELLLNAAARLAAAATQIEIVICGDGPLREELIHRAALQKLRRLHFVGELPAVEMWRLFQFAEVVCLLSPHGMGIRQLMEAFACGTPVVALRCGAMPEFVSSASGTLVDDDHEQVAEVLRRAIQEDWKSTKSPQLPAIASADLVETGRWYAAAYAAILNQRFGE